MIHEDPSHGLHGFRGFARGIGQAQAHHYLACTGVRLALVMDFDAVSLQWKRIIR
jgi:hypothetical protein